MKLAMLNVAMESHPAIMLSSGGYIDIKVASHAGLFNGAVPSSIRDILHAGHDRLDSVRRLLDSAENNTGSTVERLSERAGVISAEEAVLLEPLRPTFILCTGGSFLAHVREMGVAPPEAPGGFIKAPHTITGPRGRILLPPTAPSMIDFECEFACVFDRHCHNVSPEEALDYIGGYTMINDVSARDGAGDWFESLTKNNPKRSCELWDRVVLGKQYPTFCPIGPVVVTKDELTDPHDVHVKTTLNGKVMQLAHTGELAFPIAKIISHFSRWHVFEAGDVMSTGSPAGVGYAHDPKVFLRPGDLVEVEGSRIGALRNTVAATLV
jgi:2-keto-4-pentenoate hydratase/2-oxohepta-3-ene-1,7-dioic acid hydratase in catechol pathway